MNLVDTIVGLLWSKALVVILLCGGLYFTIGSRFVQFRSIKEMTRLVVDRKKEETGISSLQALTMSLAARVGTGNIAGVATAIFFGGPGSIFWMWCLGLVGAAASYVECTLAQVYKEEQDGEYRGGPAYYIEKYTGIKTWAVLFAICMVYAEGVGSPWVQSNVISAGIEHAFGISPIVTGSLLTILVGIIIFGGVKRIAKVAELLVPFMAIAYIIISIVVIAFNISALPGTIALIFKSAFGAQQAFGGILGMAISWGVKRGLYSNEAGMGTQAQAAAAAEISHPAKQGLVQAFAIYIDTLLICTSTAFMILIAGTYNVVGTNGEFIVNNAPNVEMGPVYTQMAIDTVIPGFGSAFVAIVLLFFAFTTIIANYYAGETNAAYLKNKIGINLILLLRILTVAVTFYGALKSANLAWGMADIGIGLVTWLNIIAILLLSKIAFKVQKDYEEQKATGADPIFDPIKLGIKNCDEWIKIKKRYLNNK